MKITIFILAFLLINLIKCTKKETNIFDWGINNDVEILTPIEISQKDGKDILIAKKDISNNQEIIRIPYDIIFNVEKALDLINSKELKSQYETFKKVEIATYEPNRINLQKEEIFLAYILYLIHQEPDLYQKTKFYEKYKFYLSSLKKDLPRSPLFYNYNQTEYLTGTYLGKFNDRIKKLFQEEIKVFQNESYYNKTIDFKEYAKYRLITKNKVLEILDHICMIPILNYFDRDYMKYNARFSINKNGDVKITSRKSIKNEELIIVFAPKSSNVERMIFEGELNSYLVNYKEDYLIPAFSAGLFYKYDLDDIDLFNNYFINLVELKFDEKAINLYKNYTSVFKGNDGDAWACEILFENVEYYKKYVEHFIKVQINEIFENEYDRKHVEKAMKGEEKLLQKSTEYIKNKCKQLKQKENEKKKKKSSDL